MRVGDVLEWLACAAFVAAGWLGTGQLWVALAVGGVVFAYQGQCYGTMSVKVPRIRRRRSGSDA